MQVDLRWLASLKHALDTGSRAVLCAGSIGDGFPRQIPDENDPADHLDSWERLIAREYCNGEMVMMFDLARGFGFPRKSDKEKFEEWCSPGADTPRRGGESAATRAQRQLQRSQGPARDPGQALLQIQNVFRAAIADEEPTPCILILPEIDSICPNETSSMDRLPKAFALMILQTAANAGYARLGHKIIMGANSVSAVDARLRRPDSPVRIIEVLRPDEEERRQFLERLCPESDLQAKITALEAELDAKIAERNKILAGQRLNAQTAVDDKNSVKETVVETDERLLTLKAEIKGLETRIEELVQNGKKAFDAQQKKMRGDLTTLQHRLKNDETLQLKPVTEQILSELKAGDQIHVDHTQEGSKRLIIHEVTRHGFTIELAESPGQLLMNTDQSHAVLISVAGRTFRKRGHPNDQWIDMQLPIQKARIIPLARLEAMTQVEKWETELKETYQPDKTIAEKRAELDSVTRRASEREAEIRDKWSAELEELKKTLSDIKMEMGAPTSEEIEKLKTLISRTKTLMQTQQESTYPPPEPGVQETARLSQGLGFRDIVDIFRQSYADNKTVTYDELVEQRRGILERTYGHLVDIVEPSYGFEGIAGLESVIDYFKMVRNLIRAGDLGRVPMNCLLLGPPGTGKTAVAEAFASECGILFVKLRNMRSMWVGQSEQNQEEVFRVLRELAPVIVLRDEVDEEDSGRDSYQGDSGVSARMRRQWMTFLSEPRNRGRIFVISCSNRPDRMDAALKRSGRNDDRIPLLMPDFDTLRALFPVMIQRYNFETDIQNFTPFAELVNGMTGADIEVIVQRADRIAGMRGLPYIDAMALKRAIDNFIVSADQQEIARMTLLAIAACSDREWLPSNVDQISSQCSKVIDGSASSVTLETKEPPVRDKQSGKTKIQVN